MPHSNISNGSPAAVDWSAIETVLLDLDGTLLDKYFDDYFWEEYVPLVYARKNGITPARSRSLLLQRYRTVENTLHWTNLDFWSEQLELDIVQLKLSVDHLIALRPYALDFLDFLEQLGKEMYLVTAAHPKTLQIKLDKVAIGHRFHRIICTDDLGLPKEEPDFWYRLARYVTFSPGQTLLADDTAGVLDSARRYGIEHLIFIAQPNSRSDIRHHHEYRSIAHFNELMPPPLADPAKPAATSR
ncbi:GMP/IMP nucleotidase [Desulfofustis limnaeus]|uniref:Haloacid dehalogenase n=1 Tax=Desulfofustis limnaeus TaxID=2740163 RepID=A0ABM7WES6_9BACT|nr:GMP/IMP nucleotidase [Desulfofustis limnaeus]BDD89475.1 haloacid dehalogenase [Desulfofustis limnaeus]